MYMGNSPLFGSYAVQLLSGNGVLTSFTLTHAPASSTTLLVTISGVKQQAGAYSVTDTTIDFGAGNAPPSGTNNIEILYLGQRVDVGTVGDDTIATAKIADNAVTSAKMSNSAFLANRNIVQNGAMQIAQRATTATGETGSNAYTTCDRWRWSLATLGTWTSAQETLTTGNAFADGFRKSFRIDCTTADASPAAGDVFVFQQRIEGYNAQGLKKGTANAESTTISFWVKSNTTGTYSFGLFDTDNDRNIWQSYTISVADTWEKKTITFAGDTTGGTLNNDNNSGLEMWWYIGAGSNYTTGTLQTSWGANTWANNAVGTTQLAASTANDWAITGVQLEIGTTATPFEHQFFGQELATCQRYYEKSYDTGTDPGSATTSSAWLMRHPTAGAGAFFIPYKVSKRTNPTTVTYGRASGTSGKVTNMSGGASDITGTFISGGIQSTVVYWTSTGSETYVEGQWTADAEL